MDTKHQIKAILLDIGGVFLTNGWGTQSRKLAAEKFNINFDEMDDRHKIAFDAYETGKLSLDDYLQLIVFHQNRSFSKEEFKIYCLLKKKSEKFFLELK